MSDEPVKPGMQPPVDVAYALTTRLTELEAKVQTENDSFWARAGAGAGMLGLLLSVVNGAFTLFDQLVLKPDEDKVAEYNAFKGDVRALISIDEDLLKQPYNTASLAYANQKKQSVLQDVNRLMRLLGPSALAPDGKYFIGSYDYNILSQASYQGGNAVAALHFIHDAVRAADNTHTRSEALRSEAFMIMQVGGASSLPDAERALKEAETDLDAAAETEMPSYAVAYDRGSLYVTRFGFDLALAKCSDAEENAKKALSIVSYEKDPSLRMAYQGIVAQLTGLYQSQYQGCPASFFVATIPNLLGAAAAQPGAVAPPALPSPSGAPLGGNSSASFAADPK